MMKKENFPFLLVVLVSLFALVPFTPGIELTPAAGSIDVARMQQDIATLSQETRQPGSPGSEAGRSYLYQELAGLDLELSEQHATPAGLSQELTNLIARLPGSGHTGQAVLLIAHYDSSEGSPGAGDNASGVAVILEILRHLHAGPLPKNDVLALFTDGEELGVYGSPVFTHQSSLFHSVRVALNFDTLTVGPVLLWQTSPKNGWLVEHFAASPAPMGYAWLDGMVRFLPLDTDLSPFLQAGLAGGSFTSAYLPPEDHTPADQPAYLTQASLRQAAAQGLALSTSLAEADLTTTHAPDTIYYSLWGPLLIHYPAALAPFLALFGILAFGLTLAGALRSGQLTWPGLRRAVARLLLSLLLLMTAQIVLELGFLILNPAVPLLPYVKLAVCAPLLLALFHWEMGLGASLSPQISVRKPRVAWLRLTRPAVLPASERAWASRLLLAVLVAWSGFMAPMFSLLPLVGLLLTLIAPGLQWLPNLPDRLRRALHLAALALVLLLWVPAVAILYLITGPLVIPAVLGALLLGLLCSLGVTF